MMNKMSTTIQSFFTEAARTYEMVNHLLTFGLDILWRRRVAKSSTLSGVRRVLDVCSGTGETAVYLKRFGGARVEVCAVDFSIDMLAVARRKPDAMRLHFALGDAYNLPFPDSSFDIVTISYATRNLKTSHQALVCALAEFYRVLRPGGLFINLETSQPSSATIRTAFHLYVKYGVRWIGQTLSGSSKSYQYLSSSVRRFYNPEQLATAIRDAGFTTVTFSKFLYGSFAVHYAKK
jgi:demethylmenaquinone methyltransferase/2-methoxy-6-polyprenyl-1,4-benzoquinol methylase